MRQVTQDLVAEYKLAVDFEPHPYAFPDIVLGKFGIEVKFTEIDTWRSVANSAGHLLVRFAMITIPNK